MAAFVGYLLAPGADPIRGSAVTAGVFLLALGAGVLNQYQEREGDALMMRTRMRPLPSGAADPYAALYLSLALMALGFCVLIVGAGGMAAALGFAAIVSYNVLYTPLKRVTSFCVVVGAIAGAMPVAIGWAASGAPFNSPVFVLAFGFFYLWQMPHFWLMALRDAEDYRRAGIRITPASMPAARMRRITALWMMATSASASMLALVGLGGAGAVFVGAGALVLCIVGLRYMLGIGEPPQARIINAFVLAVMLAIAAARLAGRA